MDARPIVFNAGAFESARSGFADYARDGETGRKLRTRVNRITLEDREQKVLALRALHEKLRDVASQICDSIDGAPNSVYPNPAGASGMTFTNRMTRFRLVRPILSSRSTAHAPFYDLRRR
ncbi:MAG: hypothetical protein L3J97_06015 [Thermoplasmata archaeon]|nr:hypothetical protein [Thermoplasmata archaeon]